jgi:hypothetical protein
VLLKCYGLPIHVLGGFSDAETETELLEDFCVVWFGAVQVLAFGDELERGVAANAGLEEDALKRLEILGVDDQQLVLVELDLHGPAGADHGNPGAAVMHEKVFKVAAVALQDRQVNLLAVQVLVGSAVTVMTGFHDHVDHFTEWIEQIEKHIEEPFARNRGDQNRNLQLRFDVAIGADAKALPGDDLQVERRPHGLGQPEIAVTIHLQVSRQILWNHETPCR